MTRIPVKISWIMVLFINAIMIFPLIGGDITAIIIIGLVTFTINYIFFSIRYCIIGNQLIVKGGLSKPIKINIEEIRKIEKTWNLISSPAPSINGRVEIYYNNDSIVISPKNYENFKNELLKINPKIEFKP